MSSVARKIVEAIQHSMLASLAFATWAPIVQVMGFRFISDPESFGLTGSFVSGVLLATLMLLVVAWALARLARTHITGSPRHRVHQSQSDLDVWTDPPEGGLRPSWLMRWIVERLAAIPRFGWSGTRLIVFVIVGSLALGLAVVPDTAWGRVHPSLGSPENRDPLWLPIIAFMLIHSLRDWATRNRLLLAA